MGAVGLVQAVAGVAYGEDVTGRDIVAAHGEGASDGVLRELVPEGTDAVVGGVAAVEGGVGEVETDVHDSHHDPFARVGLG